MKNNRSNSYYLITGANQNLWVFDSKVLFLGDWCLDYKQKNIWKAMDYIVNSPPVDEISKRDCVYKSARKLENTIFPWLCSKLNAYHQVDYSHRFWKIVLGHWFRCFIDIVYNRVETLDRCIKEYNVDGVSVFNSENYLLATKDTRSAEWASDDDMWNNMLYSRIIEILEYKSIEITTLDNTTTSNYFDINYPTRSHLTVRKYILKKLNKIACYFFNNNDGFIINSYLPISGEMKLHQSFGQIPKIYTSKGVNIEYRVNKELRRRLSGEICTDLGNIELVARSLLFELLPICYLEGFSKLKRQVFSLRWPNNPKFIFTSNNFASDEIFKLWTAYKVQKGSKYIIGQHGNNPGVHRYMVSTVDMEVSDKYITWGWSDLRKKIKPAFIFKMAQGAIAQNNPSGGVLLVISHYPHRTNLWDETSEYNNHFYNLIRVIKELQSDIRGSLTVRLHSAASRFNYYEERRLLDFDSKIKIDSGSVAISKVIADNRLVVHGYDSTGILETLSSNIPTLVFFGGDMNHIRNEAKPYYQLLVDAGIVHFTVESISKHINSIWGDIDTWWLSRIVQAAKMEFCNQYANMSSTPILDLNHLIDEDK